MAATPAAHTHQSSFVLASSLLNKSRGSAPSVTPAPATSLSRYKSSESIPALPPSYLTTPTNPPAACNTSPHTRFTRDFRSQLRDVSQKTVNASTVRPQGFGWGADLPAFASASSPAQIGKVSSERKSSGILKKSSARREEAPALTALFAHGDSAGAASLHQDALRHRSEQTASLQSLKSVLCTGGQGHPAASRWPTTPVHSPLPPAPGSKVRKVRFQDEVRQEKDTTNEWSEVKKNLKRKLNNYGSKFFDQN